MGLQGVRAAAHDCEGFGHTLFRQAAYRARVESFAASVGAAA